MNDAIQRRQYKRCYLVMAALLLETSSGCGGRPKRVQVPEFTPQVHAEAAILAADENSDGLISQEELVGMPGLRAGLASIDQNGDEQIDAHEIAARLQSYLDDEIGLLSLTCVVKMNGAPLDGATVDFIPADFLADVLKPARSVTRRDGAGPIQLADKSLPGIAPGIYRVSISKMIEGRETIPARYNENTDLGFEVANIDGGRPATFNLRSR